MTEVSQESVRLGWALIPGTTGYILRWKEETGEQKKKKKSKYTL